MRSVLIGAVILSFLPIIKGQQCTADTFPVLKMCYQNEASGSTIMMDFGSAEEQAADSCRCTVQILQGTQLSFNQIFAYNHQYCGTKFEFQDYSFNCRGSATLDVTDGFSANIEFNKVDFNKASKYCYSLVVEDDSPNPSMIISCEAPFINTTTTSTVSTTTTSTTTTTTTTTTPKPNTTTNEPTTTTTKKPTTTTTKPTTTTTKAPTTTTKSTTTTKNLTTTTKESPTTTKQVNVTEKSNTTTSPPTSSTTTSTTKGTTRANTQPVTATTGKTNTSTSGTTKTTSADTEKASHSSVDDIPWMMVIPLIGVGAFLILTIIIVLVLLCRRKNKPVKSDEFEQPYVAHDNPAMTLKDEQKPANNNAANEIKDSSFTVDKKESNKSAETKNGEAVKDSNNDVTPQKNGKSDTEQNVKY